MDGTSEYRILQDLGMSMPIIEAFKIFVRLDFLSFEKMRFCQNRIGCNTMVILEIYVQLGLPFFSER